MADHNQLFNAVHAAGIKSLPMPYKTKSKNTLCDDRKVTCGVPHGTVLGLYFSAYTYVSSSHGQITALADDTTTN